MRDRVNLLTVKQIAHRFAVAKIDVANGYVFGATGNVRMLDLRIVKIVEIIKDDNLMSGRQQFFDEVRSNKTRAACDQNSHEAKLTTERQPPNSKHRSSTEAQSNTVQGMTAWAAVDSNLTAWKPSLLIPKSRASAKADKTSLRQVPRR